MLTAATRSVLFALVCILLVATLVDPPPAMADSRENVIDIPAGDLSAALDLLSKQTGTGTVYRPEQVKGLKTRGVHGTLSAEAAAKKLVEGTGLEVSTDSTGAVLIAAPQSKTHTSSS